MCVEIFIRNKYIIFQFFINIRLLLELLQNYIIFTKAKVEERRLKKQKRRDLSKGRRTIKEIIPKRR